MSRAIGGKSVSVAQAAASVRWRSRTTFFLALAGAAIGLNSFWRLPYLMGEYGGGVFFLVYLSCLFLVAVPLMAAEVFAGVYGRSDPVASITRVAEGAGVSARWTGLAYLMCFTALLMLGVSVLMGGMMMTLLRDMWQGEFAAASAVNMGAYLDTLVSQPFRLIVTQSAFLALAILIVAAGVRLGLGLFFWFAIPVFLVSLAILVRFALDYGDTAAAGDFLFALDGSQLTFSTCAVALGHAVFSLGAGVGTGIAFGASAPARVPVLRSVLAVALLHIFVTLGVGLAIFPILFAHNLEAGVGPALLLVGLPIAYGGMAEGEVFGALFYFAVTLALLTTAVAMFEPVVSLLKGRMGLRRLHGAAVAGLITWLLAGSFALSLSPLAGEGSPPGLTSLQVVDTLSARVFLPLTALLLALLVGWRLGRDVVRGTLSRATGFSLAVWRLLLRVPVPLAIVLTAVLAAAGSRG